MRTPLKSGTYRLTDKFGPRGQVPGVPGTGSFHTGQDYAAPIMADGTKGTIALSPILAAHSGLVTRSWYDRFKDGRPAGGYMTEIRGDDGYVTRYAHMNESGYIPAGTRIKEGAQIGRVGMSGAANGYHLHFEVLKNGKFIDPLAVIENPKRRKKTMTTLYHKSGTKLYALAGDSPGTPANWLETEDYSGLAVPWAQVHGSAITLAPGSFESFKSRYLSKVSISGNPSSGGIADTVNLSQDTITKLTAPKEGKIVL